MESDPRIYRVFKHIFDYCKTNKPWMSQEHGDIRVAGVTFDSLEDCLSGNFSVDCMCREEVAMIFPDLIPKADHLAPKSWIVAICFRDKGMSVKVDTMISCA